MGMFDMVIVLDVPSIFSCNEGHPLDSFHTKDLPEPSMNTYLLLGGRLYQVAHHDGHGSVEDPRAWQIEGAQAIHTRRHELHEIKPATLRIYTACERCEPILVRTAVPHDWSDLIVEHPLFADFRLTLRPGEEPRIQSMSGTRGEVEADLCKRGLFVLAADNTLAVAHRELKRARQQALTRSTTSIANNRW
jgi:hypothetical protein